MLIGTVAFSTVFTLNVEKAYAEANISGLEDDSVGRWENTEVVDEFGDATGESAIRSVVSGTFSNTATAESDLTVVAFITMGVPAYSSDFISDNATLISNTLTYPTSAYNVQFRLLEYDKTPATHLKSDNMILKTKVGEDEEDALLEEIISKINERFDGIFSEGDRVIVETLYNRAKENKKLNRQAQKNDEEVYTKSIFPEVFKQVAQDCYIEQMKAFSKLFEDKRFYDTVMATLAQETYRHSNDCAL